MLFFRVLVPSTMVGAIIGKEGKKIKDLTDKTGTEWVDTYII